MRQSGAEAIVLRSTLEKMQSMIDQLAIGLNNVFGVATLARQEAANLAEQMAVMNSIIAAHSERLSNLERVMSVIVPNEYKTDIQLDTPTTYTAPEQHGTHSTYFPTQFARSVSLSELRSLPAGDLGGSVIPAPPPPSPSVNR
jgi:hypothetical protein